MTDPNKASKSTDLHPENLGVDELAKQIMQVMRKEEKNLSGSIGPFSMLFSYIEGTLISSKPKGPVVPSEHIKPAERIDPPRNPKPGK